MKKTVLKKDDKRSGSLSLEPARKVGLCPKCGRKIIRRYDITSSEVFFCKTHGNVVDKKKSGGYLANKKKNRLKRIAENKTLNRNARRKMKARFGKIVKRPVTFSV